MLHASASFPSSPALLVLVDGRGGGRVPEGLIIIVIQYIICPYFNFAFALGLILFSIIIMNA